MNEFMQFYMSFFWPYWSQGIPILTILTIIWGFFLMVAVLAYEFMKIKDKHE